MINKLNTNWFRNQLQSLSFLVVVSVVGTTGMNMRHEHINNMLHHFYQTILSKGKPMLFHFFSSNFAQSLYVICNPVSEMYYQSINLVKTDLGLPVLSNLLY